MMKTRTSFGVLSAMLASGTAVAHEGAHLTAQVHPHLAAEPLLLSVVAGAVVLWAVRAFKRGGGADGHND